MGLLSMPILGFVTLSPGPPSFPRESAIWVHGSPYLGHSDFKRDFRGLSPAEIEQQIAHFRTAEPWRRAILFGL
jgi:hypothetical protein